MLKRWAFLKGLRSRRACRLRNSFPACWPCILKYARPCGEWKNPALSFRGIEALFVRGRYAGCSSARAAKSGPRAAGGGGFSDFSCALLRRFRRIRARAGIRAGIRPHAAAIPAGLESRRRTRLRRRLFTEAAPGLAGAPTLKAGAESKGPASACLCRRQTSQ